MKKTLTLLSGALVVSTMLSAQITITQNDLPQSGYTYLVYTDTTNSVAIGSPGPAAQTWNFSTLVADYPSVPTYGLTSWTPYASDFPVSNIYTYGPAALYSSLAGGAPVGSQGMNKGYMFWRTDSSGFHIAGFRADSGAYANVNVHVTPNELLIGTPATYNSTFNNTSSWTFPMAINAADYDTFYTSRTVKVITSDAWGDLTTPAGFFPAVLRMHEYYVKTDSVYIRFNNILIYSQEVLRDTGNNYLFMANGLHYPVAIVHADVADNVKSVEYYSGVIMSVPDTQEESASSTVFPNPVREDCRIELADGFADGQTMRFSLYDVTGSVVRDEYIRSSSFIAFQRNNLVAGIYLYTVTNSEGQMTTGKINITD